MNSDTHPSASRPEKFRCGFCIGHFAKVQPRVRKVRPQLSKVRLRAIPLAVVACCAILFTNPLLSWHSLAGAAFGQDNTSEKKLPTNPGITGAKREQISKGSNLQLLVELQDRLEAIIEESGESVVSIARVSKNTLEDPTSPDFVPKQFGTGVAISEQGLILTCYHLLGDPNQNDYYVWLNGVPFRARKVEKVKQVIGADPWTDLAVLKIDSKLKPIRLAKAYKPRRGQLVISLGNPYGIAKDGNASASFGIISNLLRQRSLKSASELEGAGTEKLSQYGTLLQTDAKLHRGTSGGPLINLQGEMVGLCTSLTAANHFDLAAGFAIPVDQTFLRTVGKLQEGKSAEFGFLGIATRELSLAQRQQFQKGVIVTQVVSNTPADICGLKFGDVITHVNDKEISSSTAMLRELSGRFADDKISIRVQRKPFPNSDYKKLDIEVRLGKKKINSIQPPIGVNDVSVWRGMTLDYPTAIDDLASHHGRIDPEGCIVVTSVEQSSPAFAAGIRANDFVSHVNGKRVSNPRAFFGLVNTETGSVELTRSNGKDKPADQIRVALKDTEEKE